MRMNFRIEQIASAIVCLFFALMPCIDHAIAQNNAKVEIAPQISHSSPVKSVAFSHDGKWDVASGQVLQSLDGHTGWDFDGAYDIRSGVNSAAFSPDGKRLLSGGGDYAIKLWDLATGKTLHTFQSRADWVNTVAVSRDGARLASGGEDKTVKLWDTASGRLVHVFTGHERFINSVAFSPDGTRVASGSDDKTLTLWDVATGKPIRTYQGHQDAVLSVAFSSDGKRLVSTSSDTTTKLWDAQTGKLLRTLKGPRDEEARSVAFSPDGSLIASGGLWNGATGKRICTLSKGEVGGLVFSPDGGRLLSASAQGELLLYDTANCRLISHWPTGADSINSLALSADGTQALSGHPDGTVRLWDVPTAKLIRTVAGHVSRVSSVAFMPDGRGFVTGSNDTTIRLWDASTGGHIATLVGGRGSEWLAMTRAGFFASSPSVDGLLGVVRGASITTVDQLHQSLFNPDLVREALADDPEGEVRRAAEVINLEKVLDSGPAPLVEIISHQTGGKSEADLVQVKVRITDRGKGIGRIEWRVNGVTVQVSNHAIAARPDYEFTQTLALDPGENAIEVVAYNASNLQASPPAAATISFTGTVDAVKPTLHVLAIGINKYVDKGGVAPGQTQRTLFPELGLAVGDATMLGEELKKVGAGLYGSVNVRTALDGQATAAGLDEIVSEMAAIIHPRDTFVLFAAAHGYSHDGRFYLIPQDYQGGITPEALDSRAIDQTKLQDWIANRIKAKKALILLDTCEAGALTSGYARSRIDAPASEAGIGRLHEATGRPVLTAAAQGQDAYEGRIGTTGERHGVFTWAVLDALHNGDTNGNGVIELSELVAHVQRVVPGLAKRLATAMTTTEPASIAQTPRFGSRGEDFALVRRLP